MFKRRPASLADVVRLYLRESGMETPLLQKRLIEAWDKVTGPIVAQYTGEKKNTQPDALRANQQSGP